MGALPSQWITDLFRANSLGSPAPGRVREDGRMSTLVIRPATAADVDALVEVHTRARTAAYLAGGLTGDSLDDPADREERRAAWARGVESSDRTALCAAVGDRVVGVAAMGPALADYLEPRDDPSAIGQLFQIHVLPGMWSQGIGSRLHEGFVDYLRSAGRPIGLLEVWQGNARAQSFYTRHGWAADGRRRPGPQDVPFLFLRLQVGG